MRVNSTSTLERDILTEWDRSFADIDHDFPGIGAFTGAELLAFVRRVDRDAAAAEDADAGYARRDELHLQLIALAQDGHTGALHALMIMFRPAVRSAVHRCALREYGMPAAEAVDSGTSVLWESIMSYPLERTSRVAGNLRGMLLKQLSREFGFLRRQESPIDDEYLRQLVDTDTHAGDSPVTPGRTALEDLVTVLSWAVSQDLVTREEVQLLARIELADDPGVARDETARSLGLTRETLNRRVHRIRTKLMRSISGDVRSTSRTCPRRK